MMDKVFARRGGRCSLADLPAAIIAQIQAVVTPAEPQGTPAELVLPDRYWWDSAFRSSVDRQQWEADPEYRKLVCQRVNSVVCQSQ